MDKGIREGQNVELRGVLTGFFLELEGLLKRKEYPDQRVGPKGELIHLPNRLELTLTRAYNKTLIGFKLAQEGNPATPLLVSGDFPDFSGSDLELPCIEVKAVLVRGSERLSLLFGGYDGRRLSEALIRNRHPQFVDQILEACKEWADGKDVEMVRRKHFPEGVPKTRLEEVRDEFCRRFLALFGR